MQKVKIFKSLLATLSILFVLGATPLGMCDCSTLTVYAVNGVVPDNVYNGDNGGNANNGDDDISADDVADLYGVEKPSNSIKDSDTADNFIVRGFKWIGSHVVEAVVLIAPALFTAMIVCDCVVILFPIFRPFFSSTIPFQCFSDTCSQITGITHQPKNGGPGGSAPPPPPSGGPGGPDSQTKLGQFTTYVKEMGITAIFSFLLLYLAWSGILMQLLSKGVAFLSNLINGWL